MAEHTYTKEEFFAELDKETEETIRTRIVVNHYGEGSIKHALAEEYLRIKDQARRDEREDNAHRVNVEAKDAAISSASSAKEANEIAKRANNFAIGALVVSLLGAALSLAMRFGWF